MILQKHAEFLTLEIKGLLPLSDVPTLSISYIDISNN
jgi:hypothetical protein